ncbi:hypothetical protein M2T78_14345 [Elizabethkingia ursingii]|uniref:hypothetical protein n=1 Tax=Elizabethkingia ursingii TaxID=1756150 RepID=UPI00201106BF|nr:hypothetical protein [Elizabethkingia ursingii]MCL1665445.1 hypothetical protein [Elizabethkingia ursingii]
MTKNLSKASLWGILTLSLLSSCRTEDNLTQQQKEKDMRFAVFVPKSGEIINYANGFASLMKKYDQVHLTNISGINNKPVIKNLSASTDKNTSILQDIGKYVEFNIRSQTVIEENGNKWVVFPKVENDKVTGLIIATLRDKETQVVFTDLDSNDGFYTENLSLFQQALDRYLSKKKIKLNAVASIKNSAIASVDPGADPGTDPGTDPKEHDIEGVTVKGKPKTSDNGTNGLPSGPSTPASCEQVEGCYNPAETGGGSAFPDRVQQDPCISMKTQKESIDFKNNITDLKGKTGLKKETGYTQNGATGKYDYQDNASATETANSLRLPDAKQNNIKSYSHTHVDDYKYTDSDGNEIIRTGIKMFSPADVSYLMDMLQNAKDRGINFSDVSGTMVTSSGTYTLRFTGNEYQLKSFTETQVSGFTEPYKTFMTDNSNLSLEQKFLQFIDSKMNVKGMQLFKLNDDGTTTKTQLNSDKSSVSTSNCP